MMLMGRVVTQLSAVTTFLLSAQFLTAELFGAFALASAITMVVGQLTYVGFHEYTLKERLAPEDAGTVWAASLSFGAVLSISLALSAHPLSMLFRSEEIEALMLWWSIIPITTGIAAIMTALAYNNNRFSTVVVVTVAFEILGLIVLAVALWGGMALEALLIQRLIVAILPALIIWLVLRYWIPPIVKWDELRRLFNFVKHLIGNHFLGFGSSYGADLALGFAAGPAATGLYRFGARIVIAISTITNIPLATMAWTELSKVKDDPKALKRRADNFLPAVTLIAGAPLIGLAAIADPFITRLAPAEWQGSIIVVQILALISATRMAFTVTLSPALGVSGQERWIPIVNLVNASVSIAAILILARFGVAAAALSQLVALLVFIPFATHLLEKHLAISRTKWLRCLLVTAAAAIAVWFGVSFAALMLNPLPTAIYLPALVLIGAAIYIPVVAFAAPEQARWFGTQVMDAAPPPIRRRLMPLLAAPLGLQRD